MNEKNLCKRSREISIKKKLCEECLHCEAVEILISGEVRLKCKLTIETVKWNNTCKNFKEEEIK